MKRARNISPEENSQAIKRFRCGETKVLINVNILTEGTDLPNVKAVFLARPTVSKTLMMQMIGRGLIASTVDELDIDKHASDIVEAYSILSSGGQQGLHEQRSAFHVGTTKILHFLNPSCSQSLIAIQPAHCGACAVFRTGIQRSLAIPGTSTFARWQQSRN